MNTQPMQKLALMAINNKQKDEKPRKQSASAPRKSSKQIRREHLWYEYI